MRRGVGRGGRARALGIGVAGFMGILLFARPGGTAPRAADDETNEEFHFFSVDLPALVEHADGSQLGYRFREVRFGEGEDGENAEYIRDGIIRLFFDCEQVTVEETFTSQSAYDSFAVVHRRRTELTSFLSGEWIAHEKRTGTSSGTVSIDYWSSVPEIVLHAFGYVRAGSWRGVVAEELSDGDHQGTSLLRTRLTAPERPSTQCVVSFQPGPNPFLRRMAFSDRENSSQRIVTFEGPRAGSPDGPMRPDSITIVTIGPEGRVSEVVAYQAVQGERSDRPDGWMVPAGTEVRDYRGIHDEVTGRVLDERLPMPVVLSWTGDPHRSEEEAGESPRSARARPPNVVASGWPWGTFTTLAFGGVALLALARLNRRRARCT